jgi:hypothetical protein
MRTSLSKLFRCLSAKWLLLPPLTLLCAGVAFGQGTTPVDDPSSAPFQLESNAVKDAGSPSICFSLNSSGAHLAAPSGGGCPAGFSPVTFLATSDDWSNIFSGSNKHTAVTSFVNDPVGGNDNILTQPGGGGGAKDTNGFSVWTWKAGGVVKPQAKDDIAHAYAAAYTAANGDVLIYFGLDRFDNSGDATAGFWFVQDPNVGNSLEQCGTPTSPALCSTNDKGLFGGVHRDGDLLVVSDFPQGGALSEIRIFKWVGDDATGNLVASTDLTSGATCNPSAAPFSTLCGITNGDDGIAPGGWSFLDKSGKSTFLHGEFLEGGLNLNSIFGSKVPCFSKFFAETRSSTSPTASLSDVTTPVSFPLCGASITKACAAGSGTADNGTDYQYNFTGTITNTGVAPLKNLVVHDVPGGTFISGTLLINQPDLSSQPTPGLLGSGASVTYSGSFKSSTYSTTQPNSVFVDATDVNSNPITLCSDSGGTAHAACGSWPTPIDASVCKPPAAGLSITKNCTVAVVPVSGRLEIEVDFSGTVSNTGTVQVSNITVTDDPSTTVTVVSSTLNPGASTTYSGSYFPSACTVPANGGRCAFTDSVVAQGSGGLGAGAVNSGTPVSATCLLCPAGVCPTTP